MVPGEFPGQLSFLQVKNVNRNGQATSGLGTSWALDIWRLPTDRPLLAKGYEVF
jgi:hypothetical protein